MCGVQAICSGLLGKEEDLLESLITDSRYSGHPMPGYDLYSADGEVTTIFTHPSQKEINEQGTPFLRQCWDLYMKYKLFGLPRGKTYLKEKPSVIKIIEICQRESNRYESWNFKQKNLKDR